MKCSLNSHVNGSNFSVAFDSRVRAGAQCCMFDLVIENVFTTVESSLLTISFGCFNDAWCSETTAWIQEDTVLLYYKLTYLLKTSHSTSAFYLVQFRLHCWNNLWNQIMFYFKIHLGYSLNFIHFGNTFL